MSLLDTNLAKCDELLESARWAAKAWVTECSGKNLQFKIAETYRPQERQNQLYKIGRRGVAGEKPVTWTLHSNHTKRLAADCYPVNCTHAQLTAVATKYGITHPFPTQDPPHYEFLNVKPRAETPPPVDPAVRLRQAEAALPRVQGQRRNLLERLIDRLRRIVGA